MGESAAARTARLMISMTSGTSGGRHGNHGRHAAMTSPPGDYREPGEVMSGERGKCG